MIVLIAGCKSRGITCPPGTHLMGEAPPEGQEQWCEKIVDGHPLKHGPFVLYRDDGSTMITGFYKDGKQDGEWTIWYQNGQKKSVDHYRNGVQEGEHIGWYASGQIAAKGMYRNGEPDGTWKRWAPDGIRNWEEVYKNGKKVS